MACVNGTPSRARPTARIRASQWSRPNCSQAKVRWNSPSFHLETPRLAGLNGADPWLVGLTVTMTSLHWLSRACRTTWLPKDHPQLFTPSFPPVPFLYPLACRSTGLGKDYLQNIQERERFFRWFIFSLLYLLLINKVLLWIKNNTVRWHIYIIKYIIKLN